MFEEFGCAHITSVTCPLDTTHKLSVESGELFDNPSLYEKGVRKLNFLTNNKLDLSFAL